VALVRILGNCTRKQHTVNQVPATYLRMGWSMQTVQPSNLVYFTMKRNREQLTLSLAQPGIAMLLDLGRGARGS
jgi:hypothetical protein